MSSLTDSIKRACRIIVSLKCVLCAAVTRLAFTSHCLIAVGRIAFPPADWHQRWLHVYWLLLSGLAGLLVEAVVTICVRKGAEYKWFCPSVFFYLLTLIPCVWVLELSLLEYRLSTEACSSNIILTESSVQNLTLFSGVALHFEPSQSVVLIEQLLLFVLIMGRWLLPKGDISRDELSQLLLVYIGMAADIIEFFEAFKEEKVKCDVELIVTILSIWSASLLQFTLVLTASKSKKIRPGYAGKQEGKALCTCECCSEACFCCGTEVFGILTTMLLQDGPFLTLRVLLLVRYDVRSYMHIFFTVKNSLVILLMCYRLLVLCAAKQQEKQQILEDVNSTGEGESAHAYHIGVASSSPQMSSTDFDVASLLSHNLMPNEPNRDELWNDTNGIPEVNGKHTFDVSSQEVSLFDYYLDFEKERLSKLPCFVHNEDRFDD